MDQRYLRRQASDHPLINRVIAVRPLAVALAVALMVPLTLMSPAAAATATVTFEGTLAGRSVAEMYPSGLEFDPVNNRLVIADTGGDRVLFYSLDGVKLGGFGTYGSADGEFASPRDVAIDPSGNIYVADAENNRIQKFDAAGTHQWTRGGIDGVQYADRLNTPIGVTWDGINDVLLVASTGQSLVKAYAADGTRLWNSPNLGSLAGDAASSAPRDVMRGPDGLVYVTAYKQHQIKAYEVTPEGVWNTTPVRVVGTGNGNGDGQMNFPYNIVFSADASTAFVSDTGNGRVTVWDMGTAEPTWLGAYGGRCAEHPQPCADPPAGSGTFNHLRRVALDTDGNIFAADFWGAGIEVFDAAGTSVRSIEGAEPPAPGFSEAYGVDVAPDGQVYVMDRLNHRIQRFDASNTYVDKVGARGTQPATFSWPEGLTVGPDGSVWGIDTRGGRLERFPADLATTPTVPSYGSTGSALGQFNYPSGADVDANGVVWVADTRNDRIQRFDPEANTFSAVGSQGAAAGQFQRPMGVAVSGDTLFVADTDNNRVQKLALDGTPLATYADGLNGPQGIEVAPDGTIWVADTGNHRIVHLSADFDPLPGTFGSQGSGDYQFEFPHDLAIGNGLLYVADTYNDRVQMFSLTTALEPTYRSHVDAAGGVAPIYPAGVAVADDGTWFAADSGGSRVVVVDPATGGVRPLSAEGAFTDPRDLELDVADDSFLWVLNTGGNSIKRISRTTGDVVETLGGTGTLKQPYGLANDADRVYAANTYGPSVVAFDKSTAAVAWTQTSCFGTDFSRPRDVGVADTGAIMVADTDNDRIVLLNAADGSCLYDFGSRGTGPGQFKSPRAVAADGAEGVWVADAFNYRVQRLTLSGTALGSTAAGAFGEGDDQFRSPHCVAPIPSSSRVAVCDTFNFRVKVFAADAAGALALDGIAGGVRPAAGGFNGPFGLAYGTAGELYVADWFNHRIQKFAADGTFEREWGGYGSTDGSLIFPRNVLVAPNGQVVVTDSENNRIDTFDSNGQFLAKLKPAAGQQALSRPHQTALDGSGGFWIADTNNNRIVHLSGAGQTLASFDNGGTVKKPRGIAMDSDGTVLVSNSGNNRVERYSTSGTLLGVVASSGTGAAQVRNPGALLITGTGAEERLWIADSGNDRVVVLSDDGSAEVSFGSTGAGPGQFTQPYGVAVDPGTGRIAVADFGNDRVSLWNSASTGGPVDATAPMVTVTWPGDGGALTDREVVLVGEASDDQAVAGVTVAVQRSSDGWWLQSDGSWAGAEATTGAALSASGASVVSWSASFAASVDASYTATVRATDTAGKQTAVNRGFSVQASPDTAPPETTLASPTAGEELPAGTVRLSGSASDDRSVAEVRVGIKDRQANLWLQPDGTWSSSWAYLPAPLSAPGAPATDFLLDVELAPGSYWAFARGVDEAGNVDPTASGASFSVTSGSPDTAPPETTLASPTAGEELPAGTVRLSGSASDDRSVAEVRVGIKDRQANLWLQPDGTWSSSWAYLPAPLSAPGAPATDFLLDVELAPGSYWAFARGVDEAGNVDPTASGASFSVTSTDDVAPDGTITAPEAGQTLSQPVALTGGATDDVGVTEVTIGVRDSATGQWLGADGQWYASFQRIPTELSDEGATSTTWSYQASALAPGNYGMTVFAADAAGNVDPMRPWITFFVE